MALDEYTDEYQEAPFQLAQMSPDRESRVEAARQKYLMNHEAAVQQQQQEKKKLQDFYASPNGQAFLAREQEQRQLQQAFQRNPKLQEQFMLEREKARLRTPVAAPTPVQVKDAAGNVKLYDRSGKLIKDLGKVGAPSAGFTKEQVARQKMNKDLDSVIPTLQEISRDGGLIDQSTGSGAGALVDMAAGFFGSATPGSIAVGKLKPLVDPILKLVPRFEGPQSDKDTQTYRDAAGDLANPATPNARKKAAAKVILDMYTKRRGQFSTSDYDAGAADYAGPSDKPKVIDFNSLPR